MTRTSRTTNSSKSNHSAAGTNSRQSILKATVKCIAQQGYSGASMMEIAREAGVSKSLLHYHFVSKEELVLEATRSLTSEIGEGIRQILTDAPPSLKKLMRAADGLYEELISRKERVSFMTEMYAAVIHNEALRELLRKYMQEQVALIREILASSIGELPHRGSFTVDDLARLVQTLIQGLSIDRIFVKTEEQRRAQFDTLKKIIVAAVLSAM